MGWGPGAGTQAEEARGIWCLYVLTLFSPSQRKTSLPLSWDGRRGSSVSTQQDEVLSDVHPSLLSKHRPPAQTGSPHCCYDPVRQASENSGAGCGKGASAPHSPSP